VSPQALAAAEEQAQRLSELEARVALLEQEARTQRASRVGPRETVRIGGEATSGGEEALASADGETETEQQEDPRPVLKLVGSPNQRAEPWTPPELPPGMDSHLPVVPLPSARAASMGDPPAAQAVQAPSEPSAKERYRAALKLVRERRFAQALAAFEALSVSHPDHELADDARYWRGEVHYIKQRFADAAREFETLIERFPQSERVAQALVKLGVCRQRLGDDAAARAHFSRVRREFPQSKAARLVPQEDPS
jgi:tol-pal system protein YbgF